MPYVLIKKKMFSKLVKIGWKPIQPHAYIGITINSEHTDTTLTHKQHKMRNMKKRQWTT
jgi:hypothetical protein